MIRVVGFILVFPAVLLVLVAGAYLMSLALIAWGITGLYWKVKGE